MCPQVMTRDKPRPRLFYWGKEIDNGVQQESSFDIAPTPSAETVSFPSMHFIRFSLNTFLKKKNYFAVVSMRNVQAIIKDLEQTIGFTLHRRLTAP